MRQRAKRQAGGGRRAAAIATVMLGLAAAACGGGQAAPATSSTKPTTTSTRTAATTSSGAGTTTSPPTTTAAPRPVGSVTAIGDSVMVDYEAALARDLPGIDVEAKVGEQWTSGVALVRQLRSAHRLGSTVVIGLGTNGPISAADFAAMAAALAGVHRVVYITVHVDRSWQDPVNAQIRSGVVHTPGAVLADWAKLAAAHPTWFYSDGTHLPIDGPGAQALASLVAQAVRKS